VECDQPEDDRDFPADVLLRWKRDVEPPLVPPFIGTPGLADNITLSSHTPLEYFSLYVKDADFENIATETNRYYQQVTATKQLKPHSR
jgi:hypothetical protein